jgi:hypothetical protein
LVWNPLFNERGGVRLKEKKKLVQLKVGFAASNAGHFLIAILSKKSCDASVKDHIKVSNATVPYSGKLKIKHFFLKSS